MKCLSIKQPFCSLIMFGFKTIEVRSWESKFKGELFIHSPLTVSNFNLPEEVIEKIPEEILSVRGKILGSVQMIDCIKLNKTHEEDACCEISGNKFGFVFDSPKLLDKFIEYKGKLGIFDIKNFIK